MKRKVLILGGGGFIGSAIAPTLSKRLNYDITTADNFHHIVMKVICNCYIII